MPPRSLILVLVLAISLSLPAAATAQAPLPEPEDVVPVACAAVGGIDDDVRDALPFCASDVPGAPAEPGDDEDEEAAAPPVQEDPPSLVEDPEGAAGALAEEVEDGVDEIVSDPSRAPAVIAGLVATVRGMIEDLVTLPVKAVDATASGFRGAADAVTGGARALASGIAGVTGAVGDALAGAAGAVANAASAAAAGAEAVFTVSVDALKDAASSLRDFVKRDAGDVVTDATLPGDAPGATGRVGGLLDGVRGHAGL